MSDEDNKVFGKVITKVKCLAWVTCVLLMWNYITLGVPGLELHENFCIVALIICVAV